MREKKRRLSSRAQAELAATVCMDDREERQLQALARITAQDLLRRVLAFFIISRDDDELVENNPPENVAAVLKTLRKMIHWGYFGLPKNPHMVAISSAVWDKRFLEHLLLSRGFYAPCPKVRGYEGDEGGDWRLQTYFQSVRLALHIMDRSGRARRDKQLVKLITKHPKSPDATMFADAMESSKAMRSTADVIEDQNPDLADWFRAIAD